MESIHVFGIANCDIIKKTLDWYKQKKNPVDFHDYKKEGISKEQLQRWCKKVGWETLLNKRSTTWRSLPPEEQEKITNEKEAIALMMEQTSIVKRPVIEINDKLIVGFDQTYFTKQ